ncbi:hypothetical protein GCM10010840_30270 [Deinococcus aerolatus]|uniref:Uncharacterized protein n=1 Tax=Deinococcus aerolatus TaxID=522487 RepID=A0ABQ2GEI1_9DEIO|nr:hypothetical protein [Deinococcus aerolatus]GGL90181.1 hypothetical protein GCM10010840_30270 [Deinococcus aerolatus]
MTSVPHRLRAILTGTAGMAFLGLAMMSLPIVLRQSEQIEFQRPLPVTTAVTCAPDSPPVTVQNLMPGSAGTTSKPGEAGVHAHLSATGALHLRVCRTGSLQLKVRGVGSAGWGAQATILMEGRTQQTVNLDGSHVLNIPIAQPGLVTLAFVNHVGWVPARYLTVTRDPRGPWCAEKPPYREGRAWLRPGGDYGDITGGGRLNFPTCGAGQVSFRVTGQVKKGSPPQMQVRQNGRIVETRQVTQLILLTFALEEASLLTFTVLNPDVEVRSERSIYVDAATVKPH